MYISTREAARLAELTLNGIRYWIRRYPGLGYKRGGRYRVNVDKLEQILAGNTL